jgi:hypothetical protein
MCLISTRILKVGQGLQIEVIEWYVSYVLYMDNFELDIPSVSSK